MSYILEALKKAQAERQLSSAPTIHALPIQAAPAAMSAAARTPLWIGLGVGVLVIAGAAAMWWRQAPPPVTVVAAAPVQPAPVAVAVPLPQAPVVVAQPAPPPVVVAQPAPPPVVVAPVAPVAPPKPLPLPRAQPVVVAPPAPKPAPEPAPVAAAPAPEDILPFARDLPESMRIGLPQVAFGGYMYSKNPADRLLLIDKVLRHEGEEVAPGLVLEKLLPKAAVMNFRGTRYRVAY
jgi:general secretion pathway protein B